MREYHESPILAEVTYRADRLDGAEVALRLRLPAEAATAADCWARLTAAHGPIDLMTIEIEVRELALA